jgi:Matrixin
MTPKYRPRLEQLEERSVPATFNVPWPDPQGLTISFVPDGTLAGEQQSELFRTLDAVLPTRVWEGEILRAFQTWAAAADINVHVVPDGGQPFGSLGLKQGDPRFGDIRIGAFPLGADSLAAANPYDPFIANTSVGDVYLNSSVNFGIGGANGSYDLFSVLVHEAGHVFGVGPSSDPNSPMFEQYHLVNGLTPGDVAAIQGLYGARPPDPFAGPGGNPTPATATPLSLTGGPAVIGADVTAPQDADLFLVQVPAGSTSLDVRLNASGSSLLVPRLTVFDGLGHVVASAVATDPLLNDLSLYIGSVEAGDTYYVKVESGTDDVFGVGAYQLTIDPQLSAAWSPVPATPPHYTPPPADPLAEVELLATTPGYVEHTYYEAVNSLTDAAPARTYRVESPDLGSGLSNVMTVVVNSLGGGPPLQANVYDAQGNRVDAAVIADGNGHYAVQIRGVRSAADYFVQVTPDDAAGLDARYEVDIDFALDATHLQTFVNDTLGPDTRADTRVLQVEESQQFQFVLAATDRGAAAATGVRLTITDAAGRDVFSLDAPSGAARMGQVFLSAGRYTVQFTRDSQPGDPLTPILFELSGLSQSDNLGPQLRDTTQTPVDSSPTAASPAPSFFFAPADPTNILGGGTTSHGSSGPGQVAAANAAGGSGVNLPSTPAVALPPAFGGRPGGAGATLSQATQPSAAGVAMPLAGAARHSDSDPAGPTEAPAPGEALPVAVSHNTADPAQPGLPDRLPGAGGSEASVGTEAQLVVTDLVGAEEQVTAPAAGPINRAPLMWALGLGAAVMSRLALPARWCAALVPARLRRNSSFSRERPASAGPKRSRDARG